MVKHKTPSTDGDLFKEAITITAETILNSIKKKKQQQQNCAVESGLAPIQRRGWLRKCQNIFHYTKFLLFVLK